MELQQLKASIVEWMETTPAVYLTTIGGDGYPHIRAMLNLRNRIQYPNQIHLYADHQDDLMIYFSTNTSSNKLRQIESDPKVSVYYCHPEEFKGVMLAGEVEIVDDPNVREALWNEGWERYYPSGPNDPDHTVLRLYPKFARGWNRGGRFAFSLES